MLACYEDEGNYDYLPSNKISIIGFNGELVPEVLFLQLQKDDTVRLKPNILFEKEDRNDALSYEWYSGGELISEQDSLVYPVKELREYREGINLKPHIKLVVTNIALGDIDMLGCYVEVEPPRGWVVLTRKTNGEHNMSYFYNRWGADNASLELDARVNIYEEINEGETLGTDVVKIRSHYTAGPQSWDNILVIKSQEPYTIDVDGENFAKSIHTAKLFVNGIVPENYSPIDECATTGASRSSSFILNKDGGIYVRTKNTPAEHHSGVYTPEPYYVDEKGVNITRIWPTSSGFLTAWMYDDLNKRMLIGTAGIGSVVGVVPFPANESIYGPEEEGFPRFYDLQGEVLYFGHTGRYGRDGVMVYHSDEGYKILRFYAYLSQYQNTFTLKELNNREVRSLDASLINENTKYLQPTKNNNVFFFTGGLENKTLYLYEYDTGRGAVVYETFDAPISSIATDVQRSGNSLINNTIAVGLKNGELKIIDIHPEVVSDDALQGGRELASYQLDGEIIDVIYKYGLMYNAW